MKPDEGALLGPAALKQIAAVLHDFQRRMRNGAPDQKNFDRGIDNYQVIYTSDVAAATDPLTNPGTGTANICTRNLEGDLEETTRELAVVNRSAASYTLGDYGKVEWRNGEWQPYGGGGGETQIISFQIVSSDATIRSALVDIQQRAFTGTVYGSVLDDTVVTVYDTDGCYLNEPNVDLTARRGKAVLMRVDDSAIETHFADEYDPPEWYWNVLSLCCPNFTCEVG